MIPCPSKNLRDLTDGEMYCVYVAYGGMVPRDDDEGFDYVRPTEHVYVTMIAKRRKRNINQDICKSVRTNTEEWLFDTSATVQITPCKHLLFNTSNCYREIKVANGKYLRSYLAGDILLWSECGNYLVLQEVLYSTAFNKNIISAPQLMKNQDFIITMKDNYVELQYKGTSLKMHMKTSENLYIFIGKRQPEYAIKYLQLSTTEHNSRVSHNTLHKNTFYIPNKHALPYLPSTILETDRTLGLKYQKVHQATTTGGSNTRTTKYKAVVRRIPNNGQVSTRSTQSGYTRNNVENDNTAYLGNISATANQGDISENQSEVSANNGKFSAVKKRRLNQWI
jgi:hypothetical protein